MNRKLKHTHIALLVSGLFLAAALLVGTPADRSADASMDLAGTDVPEEADASLIGAKAARRGLALPYFSFARGVRRIGG